MEPDSPTALAPIPEQPSSRPPLGMIAIMAAGILFLCLIGWLAWSAFQGSKAAPLHVVSTNPSISKMSVVTPFLKLTFNKPVTATGLSVTSNPNIVSKTSVSGQVLTISLQGPLDNTKSYTVKLVSISDTSGGKLTNQTYTFRPSYVDPSKVPADQNQALVQQQAAAQAAAPYRLEDVIFNNFDSLLDAGVSADQESNLEYAFFQYGQSVNPNTTQVTIEDGSITKPPRDPNSNSTVFTLNFTVSLDGGADQSARMDYHDLSNARLYLYNAAGHQIFDSGDVNVNN